MMRETRQSGVEWRRVCILYRRVDGQEGFRIGEGRRMKARVGVEAMGSRIVFSLGRTLINGQDELRESLSRQTSARSKHLLPQVPIGIALER